MGIHRHDTTAACRVVLLSSHRILFSRLACVGIVYKVAGRCGTLCSLRRSTCIACCLCRYCNLLKPGWEEKEPVMNHIQTKINACESFPYVQLIEYASCIQFVTVTISAPLCQCLDHNLLSSSIPKSSQTLFLSILIPNFFLKMFL